MTDTQLLKNALGEQPPYLGPHSNSIGEEEFSSLQELIVWSYSSTGSTVRAGV
jgi:hypothetical protein